MRSQYARPTTIVLKTWYGVVCARRSGRISQVTAKQRQPTKRWYAQTWIRFCRSNQLSFVKIPFRPCQRDGRIMRMQDIKRCKWSRTIVWCTWFDTWIPRNSAKLSNWINDLNKSDRTECKLLFGGKLAFCMHPRSRTARKRYIRRLCNVSICFLTPYSAVIRYGPYQQRTECKSLGKSSHSRMPSNWNGFRSSDSCSQSASLCNVWMEKKETIN